MAQAGGNVGASGGFSQEVSQLRAENAQLKAEVETWRAKLTAKEVANGKTMVCSAPGKAPAPEPAAAPAEEEKKEEKPAKVVPQIDPSVPQPVVQSRRTPLLGPSPG